MPKLDAMLDQMVHRGATVLRLVPGDFPTFELPGGHRSPFGGTPLGGPQLDGLIREVLPEDQEEGFKRGQELRFTYTYAGEAFKIVTRRFQAGTQIVIGRSARTGAEVPGEVLSASSGGAPAALEPIIVHLLREGGSDLYLNCNEVAIFRMDGQLTADPEFGIWTPRQIEELIKSWAPAEVMEAFRTGHDTEFACTAAGSNFRLRVSLFHDCQGPSVAIRIAPKLIPDAETLGLGQPVQRIASLNQGLVLIAGPMGSGKSTTQACLVSLANSQHSGYAVLIQDSLEFEYPQGQSLVRHKETGRDLDAQKRAIRAALKQAPDILAVGELRDAETIELALQAALTGRLVFAMVSSATLADTLYYLIDAFPTDQKPRIRAQMAEGLKAILGHTLLRRPGGGRAVALETLFNNPTIASLIREDRVLQLPGAMKAGRYGQVTHNDALIQLIANQTVEPMEAYLRCQDRESFIAACKQYGIAFDPRCEGQVVTEE